MLKIKLHTDILGDLEQIRLLDDIAAVRITAFLQQAIVDPGLFKKLTTHGYRNPSEDNLDVKKWIRMHEAGHPIWRLRFNDFAYRDPDYRIFYAASEQHEAIYILAITKRTEINYDDDRHPHCRRVARACAELWGTAKI